MVHIIMMSIVTLVGGLGGFTAGVNLPKEPGIDSKLAEYHMRELGHIFLTGGSGYAFAGKVFFGGWGIGGSVERSGDSLRVKYEAGGGFFEIGYIPVDVRVLYPFISLSVGGYSEKLTISSAVMPATWDGVWQNYKNETQVERGGFSLSPSFGFILAKEGIPLAIMIKGTYTTILSKKWKLSNDVPLDSGPDSKIGSFSFSLTLLSGGVGNGK